MQGVTYVITVIMNPGCLGQIDFPLLGIDAMLGQHEGNAALQADHRTQQSRITGRNGVHSLHGRQPGRNIRQDEQRRVHGAYRPEIVDKRRLRAALPVLTGDVIPRRFAIEKILLADAFGGTQPGKCSDHFLA